MNIIVSIGILNGWGIVVVDVLDGGKIGGCYLGHVIDDVRAVIVARNSIVRSMPFH